MSSSRCSAVGSPCSSSRTSWRSAPRSTSSTSCTASPRRPVMSIVIRLDVPALERLMGGDSATEVHLRQGVVEEFARRHLTAVLKDAAFAKFLADEKRVVTTGLEALVQQHIGEIKREGAWSRNVVYLTEETKAALSIEADKRVSEALRKAVDE